MGISAESEAVGLMGSYMEYVTQADPAKLDRLMKRLDGFLERDRDRELCGSEPKEHCFPMNETDVERQNMRRYSWGVARVFVNGRGLRSFQAYLRSGSSRRRALSQGWSWNDSWNDRHSAGPVFVLSALRFPESLPFNLAMCR